jgi:hypothetical protein
VLRWEWLPGNTAFLICGTARHPSPTLPWSAPRPVGRRPCWRRQHRGPHVSLLVRRQLIRAGCRCLLACGAIHRDAVVVQRNPLTCTCTSTSTSRTVRRPADSRSSLYNRYGRCIMTGRKRRRRPKYTHQTTFNTPRPSILRTRRHRSIIQPASVTRHGGASTTHSALGGRVKPLSVR